MDNRHSQSGKSQNTSGCKIFRCKQGLPSLFDTCNENLNLKLAQNGLESQFNLMKHLNTLNGGC